MFILLFEIRFHNPKLYATSPASMLDLTCPLCLQPRSKKYISLEQKISGEVFKLDYFSCQNCHLVYLSEKNYISLEDEKNRYLTHNNDLRQKAYRAHLNQLWQPLKEKLSSDMQGLDYGSGPVPALAQLMAEEGFKVKTWDPFFCNDVEVFAHKYDFITCMEVIEHCHKPFNEIDKMCTMLNKGGYLAMGTSLLMEGMDFVKWNYRMDPTHVIFFREKTIAWVAQEWKLRIVYQTPKVFIFHKEI